MWTVIPKVRRWLASIGLPALLVFIGLSRLVTQPMGRHALDYRIFANEPGLINHVRTLGTLSLAAPLPLVFSDEENFEHFSTQSEFRLYRKSALVEQLQFNSRAFAKVASPLWRALPYLVVGTHNPAYFSAEIYQKTVSEGFCPGGYMSKIFTSSEGYDEVEQVLTSTMKGDVRTWVRRVRCGT